jgi:hypothetical protein
MTRIVQLALLFYVPLLAGVFFLVPPGGLQILDWERFAWALGASVAATVLLVLLSRWAAQNTAWGRALREEFRNALGPLTSSEILWLSLLSGFAEEILFRGVLLGRVGLLWSSLLFAAAHLPWRRALWPWTALAAVIGLGLGALTVWAGSLWPAIFLHLSVNYFNLHDMVRRE